MLDSTINGSNRKETLFVANLDWLWPKICGGNNAIDGIKIDVQGMEIEVLRGISVILEALKPKLIIELHKGVDRDAFLNQIVSSGYRVEAIPLVSYEEGLENNLIDDKSYVFLPNRP
jgi:hypothetical protein